MRSTTDILLAIKLSSRLYEQNLETVRKHYALSHIEITILSFLYNNPSMDTAGEICEMRLLSKSNVSGGVDSLVRKGYLRRMPDQNDRRTVHLKLETSAEPILIGINSAVEQFEQQLFRNFTSEQREEYRKLNNLCFTNVQHALEERNK